MKKPYSVSATKPMGTVEMKHPAMGIKLQRKTNIDRSPKPGNCRAHIPNAVKAVLAAAILACSRPLDHNLLLISSLSWQSLV